MPRPALPRVVNLEQKPPAGAVAVGLTKGWVAWVDESDWPSVRKLNWSVTVVEGNGYAQARIGPRPIRMHVFLMREVSGVDHRYHRSERKVSDNRRCSLRLATPRQNCGNTRKRADTTSPFKGVFWESRRRHWVAQLATSDAYGQRGHEHLGSFQQAADAAHAYDRAAVRHFGEFACTNFKTPGAGNWLYDPMPFGLVRHQPEV